MILWTSYLLILGILFIGNLSYFFRIPDTTRFSLRGSGNTGLLESITVGMKPDEHQSCRLAKQATLDDARVPTRS